jgi:hypothetical protein
MPSELAPIDAPLVKLQHLLEGISPSPAMKPAVDRWRSDAAALRFHLRPREAGKPILLAVIGGTGTGKSTIVNRLLGVDASATSFRRTFTAGAVAIAREAGDVPPEWLGVEHITLSPGQLPARGQIGKLIIVPGAVLGDKRPHEGDLLLNAAILVDTPDLDGDQPAHHAEADRAFRWAHGLLFVVTPEKYQMTELLPYYRLARRYAIPSLFVMNKCEEQVVVEDYRAQVGELGGGGMRDAGMARRGDAQRDEADAETRRRGDAEMGGLSPAEKSEVTLPIFTIPRDDAAYDAPAGENLAALRGAISQLRLRTASNDEKHDNLASASSAGLSHRATDLIGRFEDQILSPLRDERREARRLIEALHDMETPAPGVDVNPVTQDLERRLQQRSVLYLMGPQRMLDRVRQAPGVLVRLPRVAWDYVMRGDVSRSLFPSNGNSPREVPDFKAILSDQFSVLQSRIDDLLQTSPAARKWVSAGGKSYELARLSPANAGAIAEEELADLRNWLEKRWNATPRDTKAVHALLRYLPGGEKLTAIAESAPYLLVIALIAHHALFGTDLLVLGGYTIATWLTERLSNEVAARTRATNTRIADRFTRLAHEQIDKLCTWIDRQAVPARMLDQLERTSNELAAAAGLSGA